MFKYAFFVMLALVFFISDCAEYKPLKINNAQINKKTSQIDKKALESMPNGKIILSKLENDEPLNENDIASLALILNHTLKIERDNLQIAKAQIKNSQTIPNPSVSADTGFPIAGNILNTYNSYSIGLSYPIDWIFSHSAKVKSAVLEYEAKKLNYDFNAYQIMQDAKITAANVYYLEQILKQLSDKLNLYKKIYDTVKNAYSKQLVLLSDLQLAKNEYETSKLTYLDTKNLLDKQNDKLKEVLGLPLNVTLKVNFKPRYTSKLPPLKELYKNIENRLDIVAYRLAYQAQEERTRLAFIQQFPRVSINFPFNRDTSNVQTLGVGISIDFPIFNTNKAQIDIQKATRKKMYDEYISRIITAKFDIKRLKSDIENIQNQLRFLNADYENNTDLLRYYNQAYRDNYINIIEFYKNSNDVIDKKINILNLEKSLYSMQIALEIASAKKIN
ncbi:Heavy metal RND efflux outer membrane protein, CzcC family [Desulfurella amilsii]|uniref:Heavy metal RND efflux outer membrane protein, CzcC family n=1 Tax=Desulfurella amilsii TaxID=1562698 RepID=A0A1X4XZG5_9BACT|nr:TolC family protein [Desulfurella amilsii]OSS42939.1 Heavy metal RND efflux outer membrane protein, CzcC family [Desulfurella amilsii]